TTNVLYSKLRPYLNKVVIPNRPGYATSEIVVLKPNPEIITREYLAYFLRSSHFVKYINSKTTGAKMPRANIKVLKQAKVLCPNLDTQNQIVKILQKCTKIINARKKELMILDELVKARFVEMFGDPAIPNENYPITKLEDVADVKSSHRIFTSEFVEDGVPFYRGKEIAELARGEVPQDVYHISLEKYKEISNNDSKPLIGDLLMPSICDKGQVWMVNTENPFYYKDGRVLCISPDRDKINPQYFQYYIKMRTISEYPKLGSGSTFAEFKIFQLKKLLINLPPFDRQVQFARIVTSVNKSKFTIDSCIIIIRKALQSGYHYVWGICHDQF
ncbi:restriction endonuclease subunit S, partial [Mitsuokella sp.]|uniref:restriction endonuclease subunit S n=1 Tax=Mitsuokella sp. TaxID=2049034 RepID=UPI002A838EBD